MGNGIRGALALTMLVSVGCAEGVDDGAPAPQQAARVIPAADSADPAALGQGLEAYARGDYAAALGSCPMEWCS